MSYNLALFFHICGVLTLFGSAAVEIISLTRLRATSSVAIGKAWAGLNKPLEFTFPLAAVLLIASGLYMLHNNPDFKMAQPWAMTVLVVLIVLSVVGAGFNGRRMKAIVEALDHAPDGPMPADIVARIHHPFLLTSIQSMSAAILGAILIMTLKPGLRDSIIIAAVSMILGALSAQPLLRTGAASQMVPAAEVAQAE